MSMLFNSIPDGGALWGGRRKKKSTPRKGSVASNLNRINTNVRRAAASAKRAGNIKGSVGASAGARMGSKPKPKAQARARVSVYNPTPIRKKAAPAPRRKAAPAPIRKAAPIRKKAAPAPRRSVAPVQKKKQSYSGGTGGSYSAPNTAKMAVASSLAPDPVITAPAPPKPPSDKEWLAGDSAYNDQLSEYDRALQEYLARIASKEGEVNQDASIALQANARNQNMGLNNNAEDFAARGMINSGLFANSAEQLNDRYGESRSAIETNKGRQLGSLTDERDTYRRENELGRGNARRQALQRMAMKFGSL